VLVLLLGLCQTIDDMEEGRGQDGCSTDRVTFQDSAWYAGILTRIKSHLRYSQSFLGVDMYTFIA
jgi:hypothetical protein